MISWDPLSCPFTVPKTSMPVKLLWPQSGEVGVFGQICLVPCIQFIAYQPDLLSTMTLGTSRLGTYLPAVDRSQAHVSCHVAGIIYTIWYQAHLDTIKSLKRQWYCRHEAAFSRRVNPPRISNRVCAKQARDASRYPGFVFPACLQVPFWDRFVQPCVSVQTSRHTKSIQTLEELKSRVPLIEY